MFLFRYTYIIYLEWIQLEVLKVAFYLENEYDDIDSEDQDSVETTTVSVKVGGKELIETVTKKPIN